MKKAICFGAILFALVGCSKVSLDETGEDQNVSIAASQIPTAPLESLGVAHNEALDLVAADPNFPNTTFQQRYQTIHDYGSQVFGSGFIGAPIEEVDIALNPLSSITAMADAWVAEEEISTEAHGKYYDLQGIILNNLEMSNKSTLIGLLETFEADVNAHPTLTAKEKWKLIGASMITRYSGSYWHNVASDSNHPWYPVVYDEAIGGPTGIPSEFTTVFNGNDPVVSGSLFFIPWRLVYDIVKYVQWSGQCNGDDDVANHICRSLVWDAASSASSSVSIF